MAYPIHWRITGRFIPVSVGRLGFYQTCDYNPRMIYVFVMMGRSLRIITVLLCRYVSDPLAQAVPPSLDEDADGDQLLRDFGAQLRLVRDQAGLSQEAVAERLRVSQAHISQIEGGQTNVSLKTVARLANAVGCALSLHLIPSGPIPAEPRIERFIHETIQALAQVIDMLHSPVVRAARDQSGRRRRGQSQKTD